MRILLISGLIHYPHLGGANKGNRILAEYLASRGHDVRVLSPGTGVPTPADRGALQAELVRRGNPPKESTPLHDRIELNGVDIYLIPDTSKSQIRMRAAVGAHVAEFEPDCVLVAAEDLGQVLLRQALRVAGDRVVYLAQTTQMLPFGPACPAPDAAKTRLLQEVRGAISITRYLRDYMIEHAGLDSRVIPYLAHARGPFRDMGNFDEGFVTFVNPCTLKGLPIFSALARAMPTVSFAAVPSWGAIPEVLAELRGLENVTLLEHQEEIDRILERTRILLVPSLWHEAFGAVALEAQLRGIPVLASAVGGLPEATPGVAGIPVEPIEYDAVTHEIRVPDQDLTPWMTELECLLSDRDFYEGRSASGARAARAWVSSLDLSRVEEYLAEIGFAGAQASPWRTGGSRSEKHLMGMPLEGAQQCTQT